MNPARDALSAAVPGFSFHMTHELAGNMLRVLIPVPCSRILLSVVLLFHDVELDRKATSVAHSCSRETRRNACVGDIESHFLDSGVD
jgi:hypothetical protein